MKNTSENEQYLSWYRESKKEKTNEEIIEFNEEILNNYPHDYESICHAIAASTLTHLHNCLYRCGATGAQANYTTWQIIRQMFNIESGAKLINYDDMIYPQYDIEFEDDRELPKEVFEKLQEMAKRSLDEHGRMDATVRKHMESIVDGKVPFGYFLGE